MTMTTNNPHLNITRRQRARARGGRHFASMANLPKEDFSAGVAELDATERRTEVGQSVAANVQANPAASTDSLSPHEVLESHKTPWNYLLALAIAAKARGIAFQLDGTRFYCVASAIDWRFIEGEAVMS